MKEEPDKNNTHSDEKYTHTHTSLFTSLRKHSGRQRSVEKKHRKKGGGEIKRIQSMSRNEHTRKTENRDSGANTYTHTHTHTYAGVKQSRAARNRQLSQRLTEGIEELLMKNV